LGVQQAKITLILHRATNIDYIDKKKEKRTTKRKKEKKKRKNIK